MSGCSFPLETYLCIIASFTLRLHRFLKDLEEHIFKELVFPDICDIINYHAQHHFPAYIDYVRNQIYQDKTYSYLL